MTYLLVFPAESTIVAIVIGYLLGSVPVALIVAARYGVDLRATADGNPGAWNALDQLGARRAWPAFVGDGAKGLIAGLIGLALGDIWLGYAAVAAAMIGHALPVFARFQGGKSVMTFVGGAFAVAPLAALLALAACVVAAGTTAATNSGGDRHHAFAIGARVGVFSLPWIELALDGAQRAAATGALMTMIGLLFFLRRGDRAAPADTSDPARSGEAQPPSR